MFTEQMVLDLIDDLQVNFPVNGIERGELKVGYHGFVGGGTISKMKAIVFPRSMLRDETTSKAFIIHEYSHLVRELNFPMNGKQEVIYKLNRGGHDSKFRRIEEEIMAHYGFTVKWWITYERGVYKDGKKIKEMKDPLTQVVNATISCAFILAAWSMFLLTMYHPTGMTETVLRTTIDVIALSAVAFIFLLLFNLSMGVYRAKYGGTFTDAIAKFVTTATDEENDLMKRSKFCAIGELVAQYSSAFAIGLLVLNLLNIPLIGDDNTIPAIVAIVLFILGAVSYNYGRVKAKAEKAIETA